MDVRGEKKMFDERHFRRINSLTQFTDCDQSKVQLEKVCTGVIS